MFDGLYCSFVGVQDIVLRFDEDSYKCTCDSFRIDVIHVSAVHRYFTLFGGNWVDLKVKKKGKKKERRR